MIAKIVKAQKLHLTIFFRDRLSSKKKLISLYIMVIAYMSTKSIKKNIREPEAYIVAVELGHHIFDPCSKFIANLIGLTLEFSQN